MTRRRMNGATWQHLVVAAGAIALLSAMPSVTAQTSPSGVLERIRDTGRIRLGYRADARPFSYREEGAAGYSVALCQHVADAITRELQAPALTIEWVRVSPEERFRAAEQGTIDLLCGADSVTLDRRRQVAFSTPVFPGGIGALVRADAPAALQDVLSGKGQTYRPTWRGSATQILQAKAFSAVSGTTAETWLARRINELQVVTTIVPSSTYADGVSALRSRQVNALFGERAILLDAARRNAPARDLLVLDRLFTYEPLALAMRTNDEQFRLTVDRALARLHASGEFVRLYTKWFGEPDESTLQFFRWNTLSE